VASSTLALFSSLLCYAALPIIVVALYTSIAEHVYPPFLPVNPCGPLFAGQQPVMDLVSLGVTFAHHVTAVVQKSLAFLDVSEF
jgi:hypothetical protein